jgi:hypothetical protein
VKPQFSLPCDPPPAATSLTSFHRSAAILLQVVAALRALSESGQVWAVCGNNDDVALAAWYQLQAGVPLSSLKKKTRWVGQLLPEDVTFLNELPFSIRVEGWVPLLSEWLRQQQLHMTCHSNLHGASQGAQLLLQCSASLEKPAAAAAAAAASAPSKVFVSKLQQELNVTEGCRSSAQHHSCLVHMVALSLCMWRARNSQNVLDTHQGVHACCVQDLFYIAPVLKVTSQSICAGCRYNLVVVHAGVLPGIPLQQQQLDTLTTMRDIAEAADGT